MLQLKKDGVIIPFASVFDEFKLQTVASGSGGEQSAEEAGWHNYKSGARNQADFYAKPFEYTDSNDQQKIHNGTAFLNGNGTLRGTDLNGALFYGIHSSIKGVNFVKGDERTINFDTKIKKDIAAGTYELTIGLYAPVRVDGQKTKYSIDELINLNPIKSSTTEFTISE